MSRLNRPIVLSARQRGILSTWARGRKLDRDLSERARIILMSADGVANKVQAARLGPDVDVQRIRRWRNRWADGQQALDLADALDGPDKDLAARMKDVLSDAPRCGTPAKFSAEQVAQIIAVGCLSPEECGVPVSHWTPSDLRREVLKRNIVDSISSRQVGRFLKRSRLASREEPLLAQSQRTGAAGPGGATCLRNLPRSARVGSTRRARRQHG